MYDGGMTTRRQPARTGRRPGGPDTRRQILEAARAEFAAKGYRDATMRAIAEAAGVNVALPAHYFGGKEGLFAATLDLPADVRAEVSRVVSDPGVPAEELVRTYLGLWEDPATREQLMALVRAALGSGLALEAMSALLSGALAAEDDGVAAAGPERREGLGLAMAQLLGVAVARHVSRVQPMAGLDFEALVAKLVPAVAATLD